MLMVSVGSRSGWACSGRRRNRVVTLARARGEVPVNEITWKSPSSVLSDITSDTTKYESSTSAGPRRSIG
jgi:hypothetical protein